MSGGFGRVAVLGAGVAGVCAALALRERGADVTLIDRRAAASETSGGNAGIISSGSAVPLNNPGLRRNLLKMLAAGGSSLRLHWGYAATNMPWLWGFWRHARLESTERRARALQALIHRSQVLHRQWLGDSGVGTNLRESGWLKCYRSERSFEAAGAERVIWDMLGIRYDVLETADVAGRLPGFEPVFARGVMLKDSMSVANPQRVVRAYCAHFISQGGRFVCAAAAGLRPARDGWEVLLADGGTERARHAVVALGPWSKEFLGRLGVRLPMAFERGAHRQFAGGDLPQPMADTDRGYILGAHGGKLRMSTGVYFAGLRARPPRAQLDMAEESLRACAPGVGAPLGDWFGARPSLPDCLPAVGPCRKLPGLWLCTGHQHIGLTTAPGTAELLAKWIAFGEPSGSEPFSPARFGI